MGRESMRQILHRPPKNSGLVQVVGDGQIVTLQRGKGEKSRSVGVDAVRWLADTSAMTQKFLIPMVAVATLTAFLAFQGAEQAVSAGDQEVDPSSAPLVDVKVPAEFSSLASLGETAFNASCAKCHGTNAAGLDGKGPPLVHVIYEPGHHADFAFEMAVQNGARGHHWPFGDMLPVENLTKAELKSIIAYVRALQRENGIN